MVVLYRANLLGAKLSVNKLLLHTDCHCHYSAAVGVYAWLRDDGPAFMEESAFHYENPLLKTVVRQLHLYSLPCN